MKMEMDELRKQIGSGLISANEDELSTRIEALQLQCAQHENLRAQQVATIKRMRALTQSLIPRLASQH